MSDETAARVRRECAEELRERVRQTEVSEGGGDGSGSYMAVESDEMRTLADRWDPPTSQNT